jgi:prophage regulatory protein
MPPAEIPLSTWSPSRKNRISARYLQLHHVDLLQGLQVADLPMSSTCKELVHTVLSLRGWCSRIRVLQRRPKHDQQSDLESPSAGVPYASSRPMIGTRNEHPISVMSTTIDTPVPLPSGSRILRISQVTAVTGLSRSTIYRLQAEKRFPQSIRIADRAIGWLEADVLAWLETRIAA